jgi:hypothetical protein
VHPSSFHESCSILLLQAAGWCWQPTPCFKAAISHLTRYCIVPLLVLSLLLQVAVLYAAKLIHESCQSLLQQLEGLAAEQGLLPADSDSPAAATAAVEPGGSSSSGADNVAAAAAESGGSSNGTASAATAAATGVAGAAGSDASAGARFREALVARIRQEGVISWLVPPMLQGSSTDLGGWV